MQTGFFLMLRDCLGGLSRQGSSSYPSGRKRIGSLPIGLRLDRSTTRQRKWVEWCRPQGVNPHCPSEADLANHLAFLDSLVSCCIKVRRAAIGKAVRQAGEHHVNFGDWGPKS